MQATNNGRFEYEYCGCTFTMQATKNSQGEVLIYVYDSDMDWWDRWSMTDIAVDASELPATDAFLNSIGNQASFCMM